MSRYYIGFDAGTQSVKVAVYDENMVICLVCIVKNGALCLAFFSQLIQVVNIFHLLCCFDQKLH